MQTIHALQDEKKAHYSKIQESVQKDVKYYFRMFQEDLEL
jgi:hypothetical protein